MFFIRYSTTKINEKSNYIKKISINKIVKYEIKIKKILLKLKKILYFKYFYGIQNKILTNKFNYTYIRKINRNKISNGIFFTLIILWIYNLKYLYEVNKVKKSLEINDLKQKKYLTGLYLNDNLFSKQLKSSNLKFYEILQTKKTLNKNNYSTLLKYLYKSENCCTPSNLWTVISKVGKNEKKLKIFYEENNNKSYHENKYVDLRKKEFYVNENLYMQGKYYYLYANLIKSNTLIKIMNNKLIYVLYKNKYKKFKYNEIINLVENEHNLKKMIELDIVKILVNYGVVPIIQCKEVLDTSKFYTAIKNETNIVNCDTEEMQTILDEGIHTYVKIFSTFYGDEENINYLKLKKYLMNKDFSMLDFLYDEFNITNKLGISRNINYRAWLKPKNYINSTKYEVFMKKILEHVNKSTSNIISIKLSDVLEVNENIYENKINLETVFRIDYNNKVFIPEMISQNIGRLFGRYSKYFDDKVKNEFYTFISKFINKKSIQFIVNSNILKDNLSFELPFLDNKFVQNGYNVQYNIENIKIKVEDDIKFFYKNKLLNFYITSTVSPGINKIYGLINLVDRCTKNFDIDGHGLTRLELDLDYQPRIIIDNLLVSRERFRVKRQDIIKFLVEDDFIELSKFLYNKNIPTRFYLYTDLNYKPRYYRIETYLDFYLLKKECLNSECYVYFEEVYPNYENYKITKYNFELWGVS